MGKYPHILTKKSFKLSLLPEPQCMNKSVASGEVFLFISGPKFEYTLTPELQQTNVVAHYE